jgi:hypothetical protein
MAIEQTVNNDTKATGGIIENSLKPRAIKSWMLTAHGRAETIAAWPEGSKQPTLRTTIQK